MNQLNYRYIKLWINVEKQILDSLKKLIRKATRAKVQKKGDM